MYSIYRKMSVRVSPPRHSLGGLSRLRVHQLHLHAGSHAAPVAPLGLHLVLNGTDLK